MTAIVESNLLAFAFLLLAIGIGAGAGGVIAKLIEWNERRIRRAMRKRVYPSRWPRMDYRVGSVYRPEDVQ